MGFKKNDWLKGFNKGDDCNESKASSCSSNSGSCKLSVKSDNCSCETVKDECRKGCEKTVVDKRKKIIREKVNKVKHIKKVYIQPVCRTQHEKKTLVYRLPTKYIDEGCKKDCGVKFIKVNRKCSNDSNSGCCDD